MGRYHENLHTLKPFKEECAELTQRRVWAFVEWARDKFKIDPNRIFVAGNSMGGSGVSHWLRHGDKFAYGISWVGVHIPAETPHFKESYEGVVGRAQWNLPHESGLPVWQYLDDARFLRDNPAVETPFLAYSNGKRAASAGTSRRVHPRPQEREGRICSCGARPDTRRVPPPTGWGQPNVLDIRLDELPRSAGALDGDSATATANTARRGTTAPRWDGKPTTSLAATRSRSTCRGRAAAEAPPLTPRRRKLQAEAGRSSPGRQAAKDRVQRGEGTADRQADGQAGEGREGREWSNQPSANRPATLWPHDAAVLSRERALLSVAGASPSPGQLEVAESVRDGEVARTALCFLDLACDAGSELTAAISSQWSPPRRPVGPGQLPSNTLQASGWQDLIASSRKMFRRRRPSPFRRWIWRPRRRSLFRVGEGQLVLGVLVVSWPPIGAPFRQPDAKPPARVLCAPWFPIIALP